MEKSWIVAFSYVYLSRVKTRFEVFTDFKSAMNYYNRLKINILGKKMYESVSEYNIKNMQI